MSDAAPQKSRNLTWEDFAATRRTREACCNQPSVTRAEIEEQVRRNKDILAERREEERAKAELG